MFLLDSISPISIHTGDKKIGDSESYADKDYYVIQMEYSRIVNCCCFGECEWRE